MSDTVDPVWGLKLSGRELEALQSEPMLQAAPVFKPLDQIEPFAADDLACFTELRGVLQRHNKLDRFGITLLHRHFEMRDNEVLLETVDAAARTMTLEPVILDTTDVATIDTQWHLGKSMPLSLVKCRTSMHQ